jgi:hypothetical protein
MKGLWKAMIALVPLAVLLSGCGIPAIVKPDAAEGPEYCEGYAEGVRAAEIRSGACGLTTGTCLASTPCFVVGLGIQWSAARSEFEPPPELLAGKSTEYVRGFRDAFKTRVRQRRVHAATVGTGLGAATLGLVAAGCVLLSIVMFNMAMGY